MSRMTRPSSPPAVFREEVIHRYFFHLVNDGLCFVRSRLLDGLQVMQGSPVDARVRHGGYLFAARHEALRPSSRFLREIPVECRSKNKSFGILQADTVHVRNVG